MSHNQEIGKIGEEFSVVFLKNKGYKILERNWRSGKMELDIIAEYNRVLVFIEVKARSTTTFGFPEEAVNALKQEMIRKASTHFLKRIRHNGEIRFDIISLIMNHKKEVKEIYHIEDAFFPGL